MIGAGVIGLAALAALPSPADGQWSRFRSVAGWTLLSRHTPLPVPRGAGLTIRAIIVNTTDSSVVVSDPCQWSIDPDDPITDVRRSCGGSGALAPGDSSWAEIQATVAAESFTGFRIIDAEGKSVEGTSIGPGGPAPPRRPSSGANVRLPIVVRFDSAPDVPVSQGELTDIVNLAVESADRRYLPLPAGEEAARRLAEQWPLLEIDVTVGPGGRYELSLCWRGPPSPESLDCTHRSTGDVGWAQLGVQIYETVRSAIQAGVPGDAPGFAALVGARPGSASLARSACGIRSYSPTPTPRTSPPTANPR